MRTTVGTIQDAIKELIKEEELSNGCTLTQKVIDKIQKKVNEIEKRKGENKNGT